jgi:uncharacterized protein (TIGR03663 family)
MAKNMADEQETNFPWLTVEIALYALILCLALMVRLGNVGARIMEVPEAAQSLQAWQLANGELPAGSYSPLLLTGQATLFFLFGASDALARFWPALFGGAMVLLPYLMRPVLGRYGALVAALALAVSPTLVYSARLANGVSILVACTLGAIALWLAYRQQRRAWQLTALVVLAALAVLADLRAISVLVGLAVAWAVERFVFQHDLLALAVQHQAGEEDERISAQAGSRSWGKLALAGGLTFAVLSTAFLFNPSGLGAWADFPASWARHFALVINGQPWHYPLGALFLYEPFLLFFGIVGAATVFSRRAPGSQESSAAHGTRGTRETAGRQRSEMQVFLWMALVWLIVALAAGGRDAGDVALICVPLALFAGYAIGELVENWREEAHLRREGVFVLVLLVLLAYVSMQGAFYARALYLNLAEAGQFLWFWLLAVALFVVLAGMSMAWFGFDLTWRIVGAALSVILVLGAFSGMIGLNFSHVNDPRELHVHVTSDVGLRDTLDTMADLSYHIRGNPKAISLTVEADLGPVWTWYLRDWEDVTYVDALSSAVSTPMVLSGQGSWKPAESYVGQDFITRVWWQPSQLIANDQLTWWLYRKTVDKPIAVQNVVLWIKEQ